MQVQMLPIELVDAIVSFLADAKNDLAACSLVCQGWLMPARRYLFHTILFTSTPDLYLDRLREFHVLLDKNPYLCGYIKSFEFTYSLLWRKRVQFHLDIGAAFDLLSRLTAFDTLLVTVMCFRPTARDTTPPTCHVRSLELRLVARHMRETEHIDLLFQGLPRLRSLTLTSCSIGHDKPGRVDSKYGVIALPPNLSLEALRIQDSVTPPFLHALLKTATVESLRSLTVLIPFVRRSEYDLDYLKAFLEKGGSKLRSFEFRYDTLDEEDDYSHSEDGLGDNCRSLITPCEILEELTLHTHFGFHRMPTLSWKYTSRILSGVASPRLKHFTLIVSSRGGGVVSLEHDVRMWQRDVPWDAIRRGLSKLQSLETLTFVSEREEGSRREWKPHKLDREVQTYIRQKVTECLQDTTELSFDVPRK